MCIQAILQSLGFSFHIFTTLMMLFLLARLVFMDASINLLYRLSNNLHYVYPGIQPFWEVAGQSQRLFSGLICKRTCARAWWFFLDKENHGWILGLKVIRVAGNQVVVHLPVPLSLGLKGNMGHGIPNVLQCTTSSPSSSYGVWAGTPPKILAHWTCITYNRFVLNMVRVLIFSLGATHHYSVISNG